MTQFTEKAILDTFVKLLNQMPLERITVREIIEECGISRNTFYYHFGDIHALLEALLKRDLQKFFEAAPSTESWIEGAQRLRTYLIENRKVVYHIYNSIDHSLLEQYLYRISEDMIMKEVRRAAQDLPVPEESLRMICFSFQAMIVGLLLEWVRRGMKEDFTLETLDLVGKFFLRNARSAMEESFPGKEISGLPSTSHL